MEFDYNLIHLFYILNEIVFPELLGGYFYLGGMAGAR